MRFAPKKWSLVSLLLCFSAEGYAHARWKLDGPLKPRTDSAGLKLPDPCGGAAVDESRRAVLKAGQSLEVKWEETVQHPGHFRIAFSPDGVTGFDDTIIKDDIVDDQDDANVPHQYSATITVPSTPCEQCAFQLIQVMSERTPPNDKYRSCADVKILAADSTDTGTTTATAAKTTTATSTGTDMATAKAKPAAPKNLKIEVKKVGEL